MLPCVPLSHGIVVLHIHVEVFESSPAYTCTLESRDTMQCMRPYHGIVVLRIEVF